LVGDARVEPTGRPEQRIPASAMTVYVRIRFRLSDEAARLRSVTLRARFAEGLVARIDGTEIARRYVASGAPPEAPAEQVTGPEWEHSYAPSRLSAGEHVLALEVHARRVGLGPMVEATLSGFDAVRIVRGPYLVRPGPTEMTVVWDTDVDAIGEVRYGTD